MTQAESKETFLYFGYGSNLLAERIHIKNPTAKYISVGTLKNYFFGFEVFLGSKIGGAATIRSGSPSNRVMGVVWEIDLDQLGNLDKQESNYKAMEVDVILEDGTTVKCRTYEINQPTELHDKKPHPFYKRICVEGAKQHKLPEEYIKFLESFEDNKRPREKGYHDVLVPVFEKIDREREKEEL